MPIWIQWIVGIGATVGAVTVIWTKLIRPLGRLSTYLQEIVPLLSELNKQFKDNPDAFSTLEEIAAQFKADSGKSLRDIVNRIEAAAIKAEEGASKLRIDAQGLAEDVGAVKESAKKDRAEATHRLELLDKLIAKFETTRQPTQE